MDESLPDLPSEPLTALTQSCTDVQLNLFYTLARLSTPNLKLAELYLSSLHLRKCSEIPGRQFLIAHAMRSIVEKLPQIADDDLRNKSTGSTLWQQFTTRWKERRAANDTAQTLCSIVDEYVQNNEQLQTAGNQFNIAWNKLDGSPAPPPAHVASERTRPLRQLKKDMTDIAHLKPPPPDFEQRVVELEGLLLDILTPQTLPNLQRINEYITKVESSAVLPDQTQITRILTRTIEYRHFCSNISATKWLAPLNELNFFRPEALEPVDRPNNLPALDYLERVAPEAPESMGPYLERLVRTKNIYYTELAIRILLHIPISKARDITKLIDYVELSASSYTFAVDAATLAMHFVKSGELKIGTSIVSALLRFRPAARQLRQTDLVSEIGDDAFCLVCNRIQEAFEPKTCKEVLRLILDSAACHGALYDEANRYLGTSYVRPAIGDHNRNEYYRNHPLSQLIETSRILAVRYVTETPSNFDDILSLCVSTGTSTGFRLALFLLKQFDAYERDSAKQLFTTAIFSDRNCIHELSQALPEFFARAQGDLKRDIFEHIMAIEGQYLRRDMLLLIEAHLDSKMTRRFLEEISSLGRGTLAYFTYQEPTMTFGIDSPVPLEEIATWSMEALVRHTRLIASTEDSDSRLELEGLAIAIGRQVREDPARFVSGSHYLIGCPLPVLLRILLGLQLKADSMDQPLAATCYELLEWTASLQFSQLENELDLIHTRDIKRSAAECLLTSLRPPWHPNVSGNPDAIWSLIESFYENSLDEVITESDDAFSDAVNSTLGVSIQLAIGLTEMENRDCKFGANSSVPARVSMLFENGMKLSGIQERAVKSILARDSTFLLALDKEWFLSHKMIFYSNSEPSFLLVESMESLFLRSNVDSETTYSLRDEILLYLQSPRANEGRFAEPLRARIVAHTIFAVIRGRIESDASLSLEIMDPAKQESLLSGLRQLRLMLEPHSDSLDSEFLSGAANIWQLVIDSQGGIAMRAELVYCLSEWIADHLFEWESSRKFLDYVVQNCQNNCLSHNIFAFISDERIGIDDSLKMVRKVWEKGGVQEYFWIDSSYISKIFARAIKLGSKPAQLEAKNLINLLASYGKTGYEALLD